MEVDVALALEHITDALMILGRDWRYTYVNRQAEALLGVRREEVLGRTPWEVLPALAGTQFEQECRRAAAEQVPVQLEAWCPHALVWLEIRIQPYPDGLLIYERDITRRRSAREALRKSERMLAEAERIAGMGSWSLNLATGEGQWSEQMYRIFGVEPDQLRITAEAVIALHHPDEAPRLQELLRAAREEGRAMGAELRVLRPDGTTRWVRVQAEVLRGPDGTPETLVGIHQDITEQRRAEEALRESEARFRAALDAGECGTWEWDIRKNRVIWSDRLYQFHDLPPGGFGGTLQAFEALIYPEDRPRVTNAIQRALTERDTYELEFRTVRPDGSIRWLSTTGRVLFDEAGAPLRMLGATVDITERKQADTALRASEARFRAIVEKAWEVVMVLDADRIIRYLSPSALRAWGYEPEELVGRDAYELIHPDQAAVVDTQFRELAANPGAGATIEWRCRHKDGSWRWMQGSATNLVHEPGINGIVCHNLDITERKAAAEALRQSEERFRLATDAIPGLVYDLDVTTGRVQRSRGLAGLIAYEPEEAGPSSDWWLELVHPEDAGELKRTMRRAREAGEPAYDVEYRVRHKDGTFRHVWERGLLVRDESGRVVRVVGATVDITERKRGEDALREADRRKDEFLAMLAHELRNPLAPIINAVEIMRQRPDRERGERARDVIERQARHLSRLVDDLLEVSRITQDKIELRIDRVDVASIAEQAAHSVRPVMEIRRHEFVLDMPPEPVYLEADPTRLTQVLINLLNNAAKYTDDGGRVVLAARRGGDEVVLWVRDNGRGIDPDLLPRMFDLFVQGDRSLARTEGGLGIGLTLTRRLVQMHGGTISVHSEGPGRGSEFVVRLPALNDEGASMPLWATPRSDDPLSGRIRDGGETPSFRAQPAGRRVLVVEDNRDAAATLMDLLELWGHDVRVVHQGPAAIRMAPEFQPDVVLLDIGLPQMDGYEVVRRLREQNGRVCPLVVAVTGYGQQEHQRRAAEAGFDFHLTKPVDPDELRALIEQCPAVSEVG